MVEKKGARKNSMAVAIERHGFGVRHIQMSVMCVCMTALFIARSSMGVAVLAMTDTSRKNDSNVKIYEWDKETQGLILSSFFWGYIVMQIPSGLLSKHFGGKPILLSAMIANAAINLLIPTLAELGGWRLMCASRVLMGLSQACLFPASHTLIGRWLPAHERTSYTAIVYGGSMIGTIVGMPVSGILAETAIGWKLIFYSISGLVFVSAAIFYLAAASSPGEHKLMRDEERKYIEKGLNAGGSKEMRTPWRDIFRTKVFWVLVVTHIGSAVSFVLFFVDLPTYLERGLQISLKTSASLSALPYIGMWIGSVASSTVCEQIYNRKILSVGVCRKIFNSISFFGMSASLIVLSFLGPENKNTAVVVLIIALTLYGFNAAGFMMSHLDISPNFAGVLLSLTNFAANSGSILTPIITALILNNDPTDVSRWRIVFLATAALCTITNTVYVIFGSSERQPWDSPDFNKTTDPEEMKPALARTDTDEKE
ncbi:putative inorganic phosphate cotransporter [Cydia fagiglandana]|uniref:putative inorganic phosphate cotransporter n=1 Tax=Cydia fagiglandana TaxID=1458189 RepID=UPI002FEE3B72